MRIILLFCTVFYCNFRCLSQEAGSISPTAKVLDVDNMSNFVDGAAIVRKGKASAVINGKGDFIIPFNKYHSFKQMRPGSGMILAQNLSLRFYVLLSTTGKVLLDPVGSSSSNDADLDGFILVANQSGYELTFINAKGTKFNLSSKLKPWAAENCSEGLCPTYKDTKYGFADRNGTTVVPGIYADYSPFSEGLACVGKIDEFGAVKYGFIDKSGKVIIGFNFTRKPASFSAGAALVIPAKQDEFRYAYINKKGEIIAKINKAPNGRYLRPASNGVYTRFNHGLSAWQDDIGKIYYIDSTGKVFPSTEIHHPLGMGPWRNDPILDLSPSLGDVLVFRHEGNGGLVNLKTKKSTAPVFRDMLYQYAFDRISGLIQAFYSTGSKTIEGYVNEDGIFMIIKGSGPTW